MISTSSSIDKANIAKIKVFEESVQNNLAANMVSAWDADHVTKDTTWTLNDKWGNNNGTFYDGTVTTCSSSACPQIVNDKQMGNVLSFDGVNDYINCGNLGNPGYGTISLWFSKKNTGETQYLLDGRGQGNWWLLTKYNGFDVNFNDLVGWNGLEINRWTYATATISPTKTKLYINGDLKSNGNGLSINFGSVRIAARYTNVNYFNGLINEIRIYDAVLSSSKIRQNYVAGLDSLLSKNLISKQEYDQKIKNLSLK